MREPTLTPRPHPRILNLWSERRPAFFSGGPACPDHSSPATQAHTLCQRDEMRGRERRRGKDERQLSSKVKEARLIQRTSVENRLNWIERGEMRTIQFYSDYRLQWLQRCSFGDSLHTPVLILRGQHGRRF